MESMLIKGGLILAGTVLMVSSFWMNAYKRITVNFAVIWELLGLMLVLTGIIPVFSQWTRLLSSGTGLAFFCVGGIFLFEEVRTSVLLSELTMKNRELASVPILAMTANAFEEDKKAARKFAADRIMSVEAGTKKK